MFTWLNKQGIKSDTGFIIQRTGRFSSEYIEGLNKLTLYHEPGYSANNKMAEIINSSEFSKWDDGSLIPLSKQEEVIKNFCDAMNFKGLDVIIRR